MGTLAEARTDLRNRLEETSSRFWTDAELVGYLNEGCRVVARRAETIQSFNTTISAVAGTQKYTLPSDCIRVHKVVFVATGDTQEHPLRASAEHDMLTYTGINPLTQGPFPSLFTIWGMPGGSGDAALKMKVYPVPSQTGTFHLYYYRQPATLVTGTNDASPLEIPAGWDDIVVLYAESVAMMKDRDQRWKDIRELFEADIRYLIDVTRHYHDQAGEFQPQHVPTWIAEFSD